MVESEDTVKIEESALRYKTVHSAITNHWEYFKIEENKLIKLSDYLTSTWPEYNGTISQLDENGTQLHPDNNTHKNKENITEQFLALEFDVPFSITCKDDNLQLIVSITKEDGNIEQYVLVENIFGIKFLNCKFNCEFYFYENLKYLSFENCEFEKKCYINNQYNKNTDSIDINKVVINKTTFKENFKLHHCVIEKFHIEDTDFIKNADFYKSHFKNGIDDNNKILFKAINFHELALFGEAIFDKYLQFKYVTFKGYTHFRATEFNDGLDLEYANIEKEMNFFGINNLDTKESKDKTSQETYRIVKYQLEKVGNIIDANKYAALELSKKRISSCKDCNSFYSLLDCIVISSHKLSSDYSRNWIWTLFWIIFVSILTNYFLSREINNLNSIFQFMSILNNFEQFKTICTNEINYFILLFNKISLGYLYYQFLTSIRKNTRK
ncbi:hypothetical protein N5S72_09720 [Aliarcobacter cryaerophilus]|uniref:hypothetical protein n=1 Tax=Aliarcobacter cryaerophilus TaxID=28198 RepID=UPI0021B29852|nr:hypothetical protein [Aliarcobacter cryaerophilus]MCT7464726.1 hypothetical protein [Aliarcobacter cryaerophilus]